MTRPDGDELPGGATRLRALTRVDQRSGELAIPPRRPLARALRLVQDVVRYDPKPLIPPRVDDEFERFSVAGQVAETVRYTLASLEYALAPSGWLRAYLWLNLRLLLFFLVPLVAILIVLWATEPVFGSFAKILAYLEAGAHSVMMTVIWIVLALLISITSVSLLIVARRWRKASVRSAQDAMGR